MRILQVIILTLFVSSFAGTAINAAELDCNNPKGFHQKMVCKMKASSGSSDGEGYFKKMKNKIKNIGKKSTESEG